MVTVLCRSIVLAAGLIAAGPVAAEAVVIIHRISAEGIGEQLGVVALEEGEHGLWLKPDLTGLEPGEHGFHIHTNPDCGPAEKDGNMTAGAAAGGHFDPQDNGAHLGPFDDSGHLGDLPILIVVPEGTATTPVLAPRLKLDDLLGRSLMIHQGGDNYSDQPEPLGGGGARVACGVVGGE